jgi:hypothetical protein
MGETLYEKGADGLMLTIMTDPQYVSYEVLEETWRVESVLLKVATQPYDTRFSAILDTGLK